MSEKLNRRASEIAGEALDCEGDERERVISDACGDDEQLRAEVEALLSADRRAGEFLATPLIRRGGDPESINGYTIRRRIAAGGMGIVYEAEQQTPRRTVALKVIRAGAASKRSLRRFEHEAHVLGLLEHPGIARIYEAGTFDFDHETRPFFAMEFIDGRPFTEHVRSRDYSTDEILDLLASTCDALHYAHQRGVIHRDLKPGNILIDRAGQPRIVDFGVARLTDHDLDMTTLKTGVGELIGTVPYMSPEQLSGSYDAIDIRSDVYALGMILYEALSGSLPYDLQGRSIPEAVKLVEEQEIAPLSSAGRIFRGDIETIAAKALAKEPERRYQSAAEFGADLRRYLDGEPIIARPASTWYHLGKFAKRNKAAVAASVAVIVALVLGLAGMVWKNAEAEAALVRLGVANKDLIEANEEIRAERLNAERNAESLTEINSFLQQMFGEVRPEDAGADDVTVLETLERAVEDIEQFPPEDRFVEASLRRAIGNAYLSMNRPEEAAIQVERAVELFVQSVGEAHVETAKAWELVADVYGMRSERREAVEATEQSLALHLAANGGTPSADSYRVMSQLARRLMRAGRVVEAEAVARQAFEGLRELGTHDQWADSARYRLALVLSEMGRNRDADMLMQELVAQHRRDGTLPTRDSIEIRSSCAKRLYESRRYEEALDEVNALYEETLLVYGPHHPKTGSIASGVARTLIATERDDEGLEFYRSWLDGLERKYGEAHRRVLRAWHQYLSQMHTTQRWREAEPMLRDLVDRAAELRGEADYVHLSALNTLAVWSSKADRADHAETLYRRVVDLAAEHRGEDDKLTLFYKSNLGAFLSSNNQFDEARELLEATLEKQEKLLGVTHEEAADTRTELAWVYMLTGEFDRLPALLEAAKEDVHTEIEFRWTLARGLEDVGRHDEAEQHLRTALERGREVLRATDPKVFASQAFLANYLSRRMRNAEAEVLNRDLLARQRETLGEMHVDTIITLGNLGSNIAWQDRQDEAEPIYREVLRLREESLGPDHELTIIALNNLGYLLSSVGDHEAAQPIMAEALERCIRTNGLRQRGTLQLMENLAFQHWKLEQYDEAERIQREVVDLYREVLGPSVGRTAESALMLGHIIADQERWADAAELLEETVTIGRTAWGSDRYMLARGLREYGVCLGRLDRFEEAESQLVEAFEIFRDVHGAESDTARGCAECLVDLYERWERPEKAEEWTARAESGDIIADDESTSDG